VDRLDAGRQPLAVRAPAQRLHGAGADLAFQGEGTKFLPGGSVPDRDDEIAPLVGQGGQTPAVGTPGQRLDAGVAPALRVGPEGLAFLVVGEIPDLQSVVTRLGDTLAVRRPGQRTLGGVRGHLRRFAGASRATWPYGI
jgi:hypothetical protein